METSRNRNFVALVGILRAEPIGGLSGRELKLRETSQCCVVHVRVRRLKHPATFGSRVRRLLVHSPREGRANRILLLATDVYSKYGYKRMA